jgi:hypothetical protein
LVATASDRPTQFGREVNPIPAQTRTKVRLTRDYSWARLDLNQ